MRSPYHPARMSDTDRPPRVLIVEDDDDIAQVLQRSLRLEGYETRIAGDGEAALERGDDFVPDLVVLDLGLPKLDGMEVARRLRAADDVPILMLTARDARRVARRGPGRRRRRLPRQALRAPGAAGAAARAAAPPAAARQRVAGRRRPLAEPRHPRGPRGERDVELTQREFELLEYLMRNERIVVPRQRLLEDVWGYDPFATTNTIEVFVSNLRRKLEGGGEPRLLHTIRGAGYVLRA